MFLVAANSWSELPLPVATALPVMESAPLAPPGVCIAPLVLPTPPLLVIAAPVPVPPKPPVGTAPAPKPLALPPNPALPIFAVVAARARPGLPVTLLITEAELIVAKPGALLLLSMTDWKDWVELGTL